MLKVVYIIPVYAPGGDDHFMARFSPILSPLWSHLLCSNPSMATRWSAHFCAYSLRSFACLSGGAFGKKTTYTLFYIYILLLHMLL